MKEARPSSEAMNAEEAHLLERRAPAPPRRNRQLQTSMERSLPTYQFCVMFSWFTISAILLGRACVGVLTHQPLYVWQISQSQSLSHAGACFTRSQGSSDQVLSLQVQSERTQWRSD